MRPGILAGRNRKGVLRCALSFLPLGAPHHNSYDGADDEHDDGENLPHAQAEGEIAQLNVGFSKAFGNESGYAIAQ